MIIEMGSVPKRQQPDQFAEKLPKVTKGSETHRETSAPGNWLQLPTKNMCTS